jgi:hypothetical protein
VILLTHPFSLLVEHSVVALVEQALLRQDLLHLLTDLLKHFPVLLLHLVAAADLQAQVLRVVFLQLVSLSTTWVMTSLLHSLFTFPLPHWVLASTLANLLITFFSVLETTMTLLTVVTVLILLIPQWTLLHLLLDLLTHLLFPLVLVAHSVLARAEQALLRQVLLQLESLLLTHLPVALLHLVTVLDLHLQALRAVSLKLVS